MPEVFLRFHGRGAAGPGRGHRLFVDAIGHIAGDENAGMFTFRHVSRDQIAIRVGLKFALISFRVWIVADGYKYGRDRQLAFFIRLHVAQTNGAHFAFLVGNVFSHDRVPDRLDLFVRQDPIGHDFRRAHLVAPVNQINFRGEARQE